MKQIKKIFKSNEFRPFLLSIIFSTGIIIADPFQEGLVFLENSFLINFLGVLLGVSITLVTFIYSVVNRILDKTKYKNKESQTVFKLFNELKDNTVLIFWFLSIVLILAVWSTIDIPNIKLVKLIGVDKGIVIIWIKLNIVILSMVAIKDTIGTLFTLIGINLLESKDNNS